MVVATSSAKETTNTMVRPPPPSIGRRQEDDQEEDALDVEESPLRDGRNENSLAYLCQRFCEMYRNHSDPINIDLAAKELGIQRRRMYEILNIIQSVGLVGRLRSSFYRWDGYDKMAATLERLKEDGMVRVEGSTPNGSTSTAASGTSANTPACMSPEGQRRKAVATALGERFVQIFLCNEVPQPIILEDIMGLFASCMGVSATGSAATAALTNQTSCARRLYDIANVFCSIGLVRKTCAPATDNRRKKRLYVWVGPVPSATTTPLRPQRLSIVAPNASPGSGSAKRVKREGATGLDTLKSIQQRKKSRLLSGNGGLNLEASMRKAEEQAAEEEETKVEAKVEPRENAMLHPAVTVLRGGGFTLLHPRSRSGPSGPRGGARGASAKVQTSTLSSSLSSPFFSSSTLFNPPNAKDGGLSPFTTNGGMRLKPSGALMPTLRLLPPPPPPATANTSSSSPLQPNPTPPPPSPPAHASFCQCNARPPSHHNESESPALLKAQIEQLKKELQDAKTREIELVKRVEMQDSQINKLIDAKVASATNNSQRSAAGCSSSSSSAASSASSAVFQLNPGYSPLTSLVFSPFQGLQARDAFSSLTASPSPFSSANNFFSAGLTGSAGRSSSSSSSTHSGRPPFTRKVRRGPNLVDLDDDFVLLPASSPPPASASSSAGTCFASMKASHLSPATASIASALLMSPLASGHHGSLRSGSNKENQHQHGMAQSAMPMPSPLRVTAIKNEALLLPSTPPRPCHLVATAASSLLSLTPSQIPITSPSIARIFASDSSDLDADDDDVAEELSVSLPATATPQQDQNNDPSSDSDEMAARADASSPEPRAVRTPSSLAAPSSPSPSAKNAKKTTHLLLRHPHPTYTLKSSSSSSSSPSFSSSPSSSPCSSCTTTRITDCQDAM